MKLSAGKLMLLGAISTWIAGWGIVAAGWRFYLPSGVPLHPSAYWGLKIACLLLSARAAYSLGRHKKRPPFRVASRVLGVLGGVLGSFGVPPILAVLGMPEIAGWGILASLMAIGGGVLALARPKVAGILMLASAIAGWSVIPMLLSARVHWGVGMVVAFFYIPAGFFLISGGVLALASRKEQPAVINAAIVLGIIGGLFAGLCALVVDHPLMLQEGILAWEILFGIWVLLFPVMGFAAGISALTRPKAAGTLMLISGVSGGIGYYLLRDVPLEWLFGGYEDWLCALASLLLILGGAFALGSGKKQPKEGAPP